MFNKIKAMYEDAVYSRCDDNGAFHYFSPKDFCGLNVEPYSFKSEQGYLLEGSFYYYADYDEARIIVFEHGMGGGHLSYMKEIEVLAKAGYKVFAYDHTGCMKSEGENTGGFTQSLSDLNVALNSLKKDGRYSDKIFSVVGHSWGGFSALNILKFHPDVKHIVAISGFISLSSILRQYFGGLLFPVYKSIYKDERNKNPILATVNAVDALRNSKSEVLVIHSSNDKTVNYKNNFLRLKKMLSDKTNILFLSLEKRGHNPNYTERASCATAAMLAEYRKLLKKKKRLSDDEKVNFKNSYDWNLLTEQDEYVWNSILGLLSKT